jgi:hypothetical protein
METWPLVGREAELGRIAVVMDSQATPGITGIVLAGPPGVGKTRLAREALRQARERGAIVEWVVATEAAATIPFGPVAHLLPRARGTPSTLLDLLRKTAEDLAERTAGDQLVLGVDDAHLLDGPSAALVHHMALTGRPRCCSPFGSMRPPRMPSPGCGRTVWWNGWTFGRSRCWSWSNCSVWRSAAT